MDLTSVLFYQPQQFQLRFGQIFAESLPAQCLPGYRGAVFVPQSYLASGTYRLYDLASGQSLTLQAVTEENNPLWQRHGMAVARYTPPPNLEQGEKQEKLLRGFQCALVQEQCAILSQAEQWSYEFLSARTIGTQKIVSYPPVSHLLAKVVRDRYALSTCNIAASLAQPGGGAWLTEEIDAICEQLIKLVGGRAMLRGQMVYLRMLFLLLNRIYLEN